MSYVIPMTVGFSSSDNDQSYSIQVHVDMMNDRVHFLDDPIDGIDYDDLREEILLQIRPKIHEAPKMPDGIGERVKKISSGRKKDSE